MAVKIRLARSGTKKKPYYKVVVANAQAPRDGRFLEKVGVYNPMLPKESENRVIINQERVEYWLSVGATPTERVHKFLEKANVVQAKSSIKGVLSKKVVADKKSSIDADVESKDSLKV